jgi:hypothetical protein
MLPCRSTDNPPHRLVQMPRLAYSPTNKQAPLR